VEQSFSRLAFLQWCVLVSKQHIGIDELKHHEKWPVCLATKASQSRTKQEGAYRETIDLPFGTLFHFTRCGLTSFERRFLAKELEESLILLFNHAFLCFENFLQSNRSVLMNGIRTCMSPCPMLRSLQICLCCFLQSFLL
jgi:hypothetical protein